MQDTKQAKSLIFPHFINKPTAAVHIRNGYTTTERKLVNICLFEGLKNNFSSELYSIDVWETLELLGCARSKNTAWLKNELFESLRKKSIRWNVFKKDSRLQEWTCSFLAGYVDEPGDGKLAFQFNPIIVRYFKQRRLYSRLLLQIQAPIKSAYALTLYEFLNDELHRNKRDSKKVVISLNDLRALFDLDDNQYSEYKHFNNQAIKPAFLEINEHTDILAEYEQIREKRRVSGLCIQAQRRKKFQLALNFTDRYSVERKASSADTRKCGKFKLLIASKIAAKKAEYLASNFKTKQVIENFKYSLDQYEKQKVSHFPSFLIKAIEKNFASTLGDNWLDESIRQAWLSYRLKRANERFLELSEITRKRLQKNFIDSAENNPRARLTTQKFQYDGGWNSKWVQHEFREKVLMKLLESPEEVDFGAFSEWWIRQEIKSLIATAENNNDKLPLSG